MRAPEPFRLEEGRQGTGSLPPKGRRGQQGSARKRRCGRREPVRATRLRGPDRGRGMWLAGTRGWPRASPDSGRHACQSRVPRSLWAHTAGNRWGPQGPGTGRGARGPDLTTAVRFGSEQLLAHSCQGQLAPGGGAPAKATACGDGESVSAKGPGCPGGAGRQRPAGKESPERTTRPRLSEGWQGGRRVVPAASRTVAVTGPGPVGPVTKACRGGNEQAGPSSTGAPDGEGVTTPTCTT